jgi:hypothetical protein
MLADDCREGFAARKMPVDDYREGFSARKMLVDDCRESFAARKILPTTVGKVLPHGKCCRRLSGKFCRTENEKYLIKR